MLRIEDRRADVVAKVDECYILHIEIQNTNEKKMPLRVLRYYTDMKFISDLPKAISDLYRQRKAEDE